MDRVRYLILAFLLCFLIGATGYNPVTADAPKKNGESAETEENEDEGEETKNDDSERLETESEDDLEKGLEEEKNLIIFAVSAGGSGNSGELIEIFKTTEDPLLLTGLVVSYENKSGTKKSVFEFPEGTVMVGNKLLFRIKNDNSEEAEADLVYSSVNLAQDGGKVSLELSGEEIDSVCWGAFPECNGPKKFSSNPRTTLVRDLETMEFSHSKDYEPEWEEGREVLIIVEDDNGEGGEEGGADEEDILPICQDLRFSEILTYYEESRDEQFIELFNSSNQNVDLEGCTLRYKNKLHELTGTILKNGYFVIYPKDLGFALTKNPTSSNLIELVDRDESVVDSLIINKGQKKGMSLAQFGFFDDEEEEWRQTYSPTPGAKNVYQDSKTSSEENEEKEAETKEPICKGLQFSEILTYYETESSEQFVEIFNSTAKEIILDGCNLKYKNKLYGLSGTISPEEYYVFYPDFNLTKNPVNSNLLEIVDVDGSIVDSLVYYNGQKKAVAFAQFGYDDAGEEQWLQTYSPTPGEENSYQKYKICPLGKVINEETGNCVRANSLSTELAECPEGYYRNPLTNRCKKYATTTSTLKPCAEGYYRNPLTNRCKKYTTTTSAALKECPEGYERNPETNRCRKIVKNEGADFEIKEEKFEEKSTFVAVWAIAAIGAIGIVYVLFEYRKELAKLVRKKEL